MKWLLLEEFTPSTDKFVSSAIESDSNETRYTPTLEFLKRAYLKLNNKFFNGKLPTSGFEYKIDHDLNDTVAGRVEATKDETTGEIKINYIALNGTLMKFPHSWIETLIHEMIHMEDFACHPEHFKKERYTGHENWFDNRAKSFKKFGFDITETDMDKDLTTTIDDKGIKEKYDSSIFIGLGRNPRNNALLVWKVDRKNKEHALLKLKKQGCKLVKILNTNNLNSTRLEDMSFDDMEMSRGYELNPQKEKLYGPFDEIEIIDLSKLKIDENSKHKGRHGQFRPFTVKILPDGTINYTT